MTRLSRTSSRLMAEITWIRGDSLKRFIAQINGGDFINIRADEMKMDNNAILVFLGGALVAYVDVSVCLCCHLSESGCFDGGK